MASLNLSTNGPSISKSYQSVVNAAPPSGASAGSPTYGQWAVFTVSAPLVNAFQQDSGNKESVLKVQSTGEGELVDFIEEFSDGRTQFGYVKVKDPNSGLPKNALVAWCGEGVPERTKGYFGSHLGAVAKLFHGYHVQITARSDRDLTPDGIIQKVADSSGSKYSAGDAPPPVATSTKPAVSAKPAFTPTQSSRGNTGFAPSTSGRVVPQRDANVDEDGWGHDAPQVTRTQLEKVQPAYQPTKVNMRELASQQQSSMPNRNSDNTGPEPVRGAYQPVGKVDIAAIRAQARGSGGTKDDRPETVKGSYEPVGKVDIAAIRAKAQRPSDAPTTSQAAVQPSTTGGSATDDGESRSLADRSTAFSQPERLTSLPKPKVSNRFGGGATFTGTKAPTPGGFEPKVAPAAAPVGTASRTFAEQGGKTPAQIWADRKARERGQSGSRDNIPSAGPGNQSPIAAQTSGGGEWKSGYSGKSWAPVQISQTGKSAGSIDQQQTGELDTQPDEEAPQSPAGGIGSIRDRFGDAPPMGAPAPGSDRSAPEPDVSNKPNRGMGIPIPGLPRQTQGNEQEAPSLPTPPPQPPRSPTPPETDLRASSPIRVAMPVGRVEVTNAREEQISPPPAMPIRSLEQAAPELEDDEPETGPDPARATAHTAAATSFGAASIETAHPGAQTSGKRALVQYDYEKAEDNEVELKEGEYVTNIEMVDEDWWMGENEHGEAGLFPSNYVELVEGDEGVSSRSVAQPSHTSIPTSAAAEEAPAQESKGGATATALYDYEAAEDNELSFPDGATITNLEFPDDDWWMGEYGGKSGLFPANYVELDE